jgi:hypothetical protein
MKEFLLKTSLAVFAIFLSSWCRAQPIAGVPLAIARDKNNAIVSWPSPSTGFQLEFSTDLSATNWQTAPGTPVSSNNRRTLTAPSNLPSSFFRLKNHLQYFGYWAGSVAPGGSVAEQAGSANFTMSGPGASADQAVASGMKLIFFAPDFSDPGIQGQLAAIRPYATNMLAFFTMDEPDCVAGGSTARFDQLVTSIEAQISNLKSLFPKVPTMMTLGCAFWTYNNFRIPQGIDYIALESYGSSGDPGTTRSEWLSKLQHLKSYMTGSQRIFLMPAATEGYGTESQLIQKANDIYAYAQTDPLVIGVFPFDWYSDNYDCAGAGVFCGNGVPSRDFSINVIGPRSARDLPNLRARYIQIGHSIMNGPFLDVGSGPSPLQVLGGSALPRPPWVTSKSGGAAGSTRIVDFLDTELGATSQALRIDSTVNANEWSVGPLTLDELAVGARFRLVAFSPTGKENLLCLTTHSTPLSPAPSITLVDGRFKLWSYVNSDTLLMDLGPAETGVWHTAYLYARSDGKVRLWWDGELVFDRAAPLVNPFNAYIEWGSGAWQYNAATTVDFDWVAYGNNF